MSDKYNLEELESNQVQEADQDKEKQRCYL